MNLSFFHNEEKFQVCKGFELFSGAGDAKLGDPPLPAGQPLHCFMKTRDSAWMGEKISVTFIMAQF